MDPGPSGPDESLPPVPQIDFLKQSYDMAITDPAKVATIKQYLALKKADALSSSPANAIQINSRFNRIIAGIGQDFYELFTGMVEPQTTTYRGLIQAAIKTATIDIDEDAGPGNALNMSTSSVPGPAGGKRKRRTRKAKKSRRKTRKHRR